MGDEESMVPKIDSTRSITGGQVARQVDKAIFRHILEDKIHGINVDGSKTNVAATAPTDIPEGAEGTHGVVV